MRIDKHTNRLLDAWAVLLSSLCMIHCLLIPFLVAATPVLASTVLSDEQFHRVLLVVVLPLSVLALGSGYLAHRRRAILVPGGIGLAMLLCAALTGHAMLGESLERLVTAAGSVLVVISHLRNFRWMHPAR